MIRRLALAGLVLALTGCVEIPTTPAPELAPTPQWVKDAHHARPVDLVRAYSNADMEKFYPKAALNAGLEGNVLMMCDWNDAGRITDCRVLEEAPQGQCFGAASVAMLQAKAQLAPREGYGPLRAGTNMPYTIRWKLA